MFLEEVVYNFIYIIKTVKNGGRRERGRKCRDAEPNETKMGENIAMDMVTMHKVYKVPGAQQREQTSGEKITASLTHHSAAGLVRSTPIPICLFPPLD